MSVFTAYLPCNLGEVSSFARKNFIFSVISTVVFLIKKSGGVFLLRVSGSRKMSIKNSHSVSLYIMAVHSLIRVESLSSACVNSLRLRK